MFLNTKLQSREKPIKVAFIGCGKFVSMFLAQYNQLQKITIDTIVDINKIIKNIKDTGYFKIENFLNEKEVGLDKKNGQKYS